MDFEGKKMELFRKAGEIAHGFDAEAAVMIISGDGNNIYTFTTSDFMKKFVKCTETENRPAFHHFKPQGDNVRDPVEINFPGDMARWLSETQLGMLDVSINAMNLDELFGVEDQLRERLRSIEKQKTQIMMNRFEPQIQENPELKRQVEEIQSLLPLTSSAVPYVGPRDTTESTSNYAADQGYGIASSASSVAGGGYGDGSNVVFQVDQSQPPTSASPAAPKVDSSQHNRDPSDEDVDTNL